MTAGAGRTRILAVIHGATWGGPCNEVATIQRALASEGYQVTAVLPSEPGNARARLEAAGVAVVEQTMVRFRRRRSPIFWLLFPARILVDVWRLVRLIRRADIDVVHGYGINLQAAIAGRLAGRPVVWSIIDIGAPGPLRRGVAHVLRRMAVAILLDGRQIADLYPGIETGPAETRTYYPPVDLDRFKPVDRPPSARIRIGTVANVNPDKNLDLLIDAALVLVGRGVDAQFLVTGGRHATHGPLADRLAARASTVPDGRFRFLGETADVPERLAELDVFVITSDREGTTTTAIEAMASGLPILATRVGGVPEVVDDGVTGLLVPPDDVDALVAALDELAHDPARRRAMGELGRARAEKAFGADRFVEQVVWAYGAAS